MNKLYELPNGWEWKNVSEVLSDIKTGTTPPKKEQKYYDNPSIKWFSPSDFGEHKELVESKNKINEIAIKDKKAKVYQPNSLLLVAIGATVGKIGIVRDESSSNQQITSMNFKDDIDVDFSYYWFARMKQTIIDTASAATMPIINQTGIKSLPFPLTSLSEQQRIVSKLHLLFEKIDKSIALHQKNMDEADVFIESVLNDVFGELEEKNEYTKMKDIVTKEKTSIKRGPFGSALKKSFFVESGYLVYEQYHALNNDFSMERYFIDDEKFNELKGFEVKAGDIIISCSGVYLGKLAIIPNDYTKGIINQALLKLTLDKDIIIDKIFVYFWNNLMNNGFFNEVKKGAAIPNMPSVKQLKEIDIPLPSLNIQQKVVKYLDEVSEKIEKIKSVQKEKMDSLKALKASILDRAFRGEL